VTKTAILARFYGPTRIKLTLFDGLHHTTSDRETLDARRETNLDNLIWDRSVPSGAIRRPRDRAIRKAMSGADMPVMRKLTERAEAGRKPMLHAPALCVVHLGGAAPNPPGYLENRDETCMQRSFCQKKLAQQCT
jgi:hypothetical protein